MVYGDQNRILLAIFRFCGLDCGKDHKENKSGSERDRNMAIDYESNLITVDQSISWREGVGVSLAYRGSAPDIGAHEYRASE